MCKLLQFIYSENTANRVVWIAKHIYLGSGSNRSLKGIEIDFVGIPFFG